MEPEEIEFLAEQENITVIPNFSDARTVHLISGDVGPFRAGIPVVVPVWLAATIRQKQKCTIVPPDWMNIELLQAKLEEEQNSRLFTKMPSDCYLELSQILLRCASEDIKDADQIRTAIRDIWDLRIAKARSSADTFLKGGGRHAGIDNITQMELCTLRPFLTDALDTVHKLGSVYNDATIQPNSQSNSTGRN